MSEKIANKDRVTNMSFIPLPVGSRINVDNARLDESLGTEKLVIGSVISLHRDQQCSDEFISPSSTKMSTSS